MNLSKVVSHPSCEAVSIKAREGKSQRRGRLSMLIKSKHMLLQGRTSPVTRWHMMGIGWAMA